MDKKVTKVRNHEIRANIESPNFNGGRPQILDPIYKVIPISDLLSYKGSLSVEPSEDPLAKEKKKKKERNFC